MQKPTHEFWQRLSTHLGILLLASLPLLFWRLGGWAFFDPDEGRYGEIPREMLERHDWVTPTLHYVHYFEKPPLLYWLNAIFFELFGLHEWVGRLVPALAALAGIYAAYGLGRRMWGARGGLLSALILSTSLLWPILGRELIIDMLFSSLVFATAAFWWLAQTTMEQPRQKYFYNAAFWISLALAFLSKGPVAVILIGGGLFFYFLLCKQWGTLRKMGWWWGLPLCILITAPWFILVAVRNPEFNRFFWWGQNLARFLGIGDNREHVKGYFYFIQFLPLVFFPWSFFAINALFHWKKLFAWPPTTPRRRAVMFLLCNSLFITLFFSVSTSKLLTYILPALPFLAVLVGGYFDTLLRRKDHLYPRFAIWLLGIFLVATIAACLIVGPRELTKQAGLSSSLLIAPCAALALWLIGQVWAASTKSIQKTTLVTTGGFILLWLSVQPIIGGVAPNMTQKVLLQYIKPGLAQDGELLLYHNISQSVPFYLQRRVRIVGDAGARGEINFGASLLDQREKDFWFPETDEALRKELQSDKPVYVMVRDPDNMHEFIEEFKPDAIEIIWNKRRAIIGNKAAARLTPPKGRFR